MAPPKTRRFHEWSRLGQDPVEPADDLVRRAVALLAEDVDLAGDLDQGGDIPPRSDGDGQLGDLAAEDGHAVAGLESEPVDLIAPPPLFEADDQVHLGLPGDRARSEDGPDVDDPEAPDLHEIAAQGRGRTDELAPRRRPDLDDVIGDELMAPGDELESALAFPDAAVAEDERPQAEDLQQAGRDRGLLDPLGRTAGGRVRHGPFPPRPGG